MSTTPVLDALEQQFRALTIEERHELIYRLLHSCDDATTPKSVPTDKSYRELARGEYGDDFVTIDDFALVARILDEEHTGTSPRPESGAWVHAWVLINQPELQISDAVKERVQELIGQGASESLGDWSERVSVDEPMRIAFPELGEVEFIFVNTSEDDASVSYSVQLLGS